jgi:ribosomal protein S18 acetylase RimI-like enzyme
MKKSSIKIKIARASDAAGLAKIGLATFRETFLPTHSRRDMSDYLKENFTIKKIRKQIEKAQALFFIVTVNDQIAGYSKLTDQKTMPQMSSRHKAIELERIYFLKTMTGKGLGTKLLIRSLKRAKEAGAEFVWLSVWKKNPGAIAFYTKAGFECFGEAVFKLGEKIRRNLLMRKSLRCGDK